LEKTHILDIHSTETFPKSLKVPRVATLHSQDNQKLQINHKKITMVIPCSLPLQAW